MLNILKTSEFFTEDIPPFILGAFFSRRIFSSDNKYIYTYASFKESKFKTKKIPFEGYKKEYISILNIKSKNYPFWYSKKDVKGNLDIQGRLTGQAFFILENDLDIDVEHFYSKLYRKLVCECEWLFDDRLNKQKKAFIRGFMELRGSIDTTAPYIAQDYFCDNRLELKKARFLVDYFNIPFNVVNINFRELQHDYYTGVCERNTQFRLNVFWYMENIGLLNGYKAELFAISRGVRFEAPEKNVYYSHNDDANRRNSSMLDDRVYFYITQVFEKNITEKEIKTMREELGFDDAPKSIRSSALINAVKYFTPDECVCCKNKYDIKDRTHKNPKTGKYYFEVHHVISIGKNNELDDENNMVKLCPSCHRALKRGSSDKHTQKEMIEDIYNNAPYVLDFAKQFFDTNDLKTVIDLTYKSLK